MDFSWSAFFAGVVVALVPAYLIGGLEEYHRDKPEQRLREAELFAEIRQLRWIISELEAGRAPPSEYLENNRAAIELERKLEGASQEWDARKGPRQASRRRWFRRKGGSA